MDPKNRTLYINQYGPYMVYGKSKTDQEIQELLKKNEISLSDLKVSFEQFITYVLTHSQYDPHWSPQTDICKVCDSNFTYLGKFETMRKDAKKILEDLKQQEVYEMFGDDTVYSEKTESISEGILCTVTKRIIAKKFNWRIQRGASICDGVF